MYNEPPKGAKISAYLLYAMAVLTICGGLLGAGNVGFSASSLGSDEATIMYGTAAGVFCITLIFAAIYGFVGFQLTKLAGWARIAAIVLGVLALCGFPIGTIVGGIIIYFLAFDKDTVAAFR